MSIATNYFKITELRRSEELHQGLKNACRYVTAECTGCPLNNTDNCAIVQLPPAAFDKATGNLQDGICEDRLFLHFLGAK